MVRGGETGVANGKAELDTLPCKITCNLYRRHFTQSHPEKKTKCLCDFLDSSKFSDHSIHFTKAKLPSPEKPPTSVIASELLPFDSIRVNREFDSNEIDGGHPHP
jgi:hypothetical protein